MLTTRLKKVLTGVLASAALLAFSGSQAAQADWPEKPIKMFVGFAAGGGTDTYARVLASLIHEELDGVPMVVINKTGAASMIALKDVAQQKPDGYTVVMQAVAEVVTKEIGGESPVDFRKDFVSIGTLGVVPGILAVPYDSPFKTAKDLFDHAEANPGKLRWAHAGRGGLHHMAFENVLRQVGAEMTDVPFKGGAKAKAAVLGNQVDAGLMNIQHYSGFETKIRVLGVIDNARDKDEPDLPTLKEQGLDVTPMISPFGVYALAGTPDAVVSKLRAAVKAVTEKEGYKRLIETAGLKDTYLSPEESEKLVDEMYKALAPVAQ